MRTRTFQGGLAALTLAMFVMAATTANAQTTYIGTNGATSNDTWNIVGNWDSGIPSGVIDAVIGTGNYACANSSSTPVYTGSQTLNGNSTLKVMTNAADMNALGTGTITMNEGSQVVFRRGNTTFANPVTLLGNAGFQNGESNTGHHTTKNYNGAISGAFTLTLNAVNNQKVYLNATNSFSALIADAQDRWNLHGAATGSFGLGDVTVNPRTDGRSAQLYLDVANTIADTATLTLDGKGYNNNNEDRITIATGVNETVNKLYIEGTPAPAGTYDNTSAWLSGAGTLIVTASDSTYTAPTVTSMVDGYFATGPNLGFNQIWQDFTSVPYTVNFEGDIDETTFTEVDLENGGSATGATPGTPTKTLAGLLPNSPSAFSVDVSLSSPSTGTLILQIPSGADVRDTLNNALDTTVAIPDDTTITVNAGNMPTATISGTVGGHNSWNDPSNWDTPFVPFGPGSAIVGPGVYAQAWDSLTPAYTGSLTLEAGATLQMGWTTSYPASVNALGGAGVTMKGNTEIRLRLPFTVNLPPLTMEGNGAIHLSPSTSAHHQTRNMDGEITGTGNLTVTGNRRNTLNLNVANPSWSGDFIANCVDHKGTWIKAKVTDAFGTGDVTINDTAALVVDAADVIDDAASLFLNGAKGTDQASKLILNFDDTIAGFWLDGLDLGTGTFHSTSGLFDIGGNPLITGTGILTVMAPITAYTWEGGPGDWASGNWHDGTTGGQTPGANADMTIDVAGSVVTVAADFISTGLDPTGPAGSVALGVNNDASLIVSSGITLEVTEEVAVGKSGTLQVDGTLTAAGVACEGTLSGTGGTIEAGSIELTGTVSPGSSVGQLNVNGEFVFDEATYVCEIGSGGADLLHNKNSELSILVSEDVMHSTLDLKAIEAADPGSRELTILSSTGEGAVEGDFLVKPSGDDPGTPEDERDYLGYGMFLESYDTTDPNAYNVSVFQALSGDTDADGDVDPSDLSTLVQNWAPAGTGKVWREGNFDDSEDGNVDPSDLSALVQSWAPAGYLPEGAPPAAGAAAVPEPGTMVLLAIGLLGLVLWRRRSFTADHRRCGS